MDKKVINNLRFSSLVILLVIFFAGISFAKKPLNWSDSNGLALRGYDTVEYFKSGKPMKGSSSYEITWKGAKWRFVSRENMEAFKSNSKKYAPQYGGYCAWAVSQGYTAPVDPHSWKIVNNKLYLNYNRSVQKTWLKNKPYNIKKADTNWPSVLDK